jgi:amidase
MKRLTKDKHIYTLDPNATPAISITSGEELMVETWDAFEGVKDPSLLDEAALLGPATGPIYVEDAAPGDALKVDLLSIKVIQGGIHLVRPGRGFLGDDFTRSHATVLPIEGNDLVFPGNIKLPLRPSVGMVATTPTYTQSTASDSGPYGGDIDMKELVEGSTIYMPVFVEGGLLVLGDCHAVVGDGAVGGTGAEVEAEIHMRVSVEKGLNLGAPRALTPEYFVTLSYGDDLGLAMKAAVRDMVDFLVEEKGMEPYEAYSLLSLAGDVRVSRTFRPISPVKMMLSRQVLDQIG